MNNYNSNYQTLLGSQGNVSGPFADFGRIRNTPYNQYRTVFNDIADEWGNCSEEERKFIELDNEYIQANLVYAQQFNSFLLDQFGLQFANSKYGDSAEKVLISLRNARGRFHTSAIEDVAKIKNENLQLQKQIKELEELINNGN